MGQVSVDRITKGPQTGFRFVRASNSGAIEVDVLGPAGVCDQTLVDLLARITLPGN